jgi:large subunit ribosomal protein L22
MQVVAKSKYLRISPRKVRLVADNLRQLSPEAALTALLATNKKAAQPLAETLKQAIGNAVNNFNLNKQNLVIKEIQIGEGPVFKRWRAVSRGRAHPILKRTSHIRVVLEDKTEKEKVVSKEKRSRRGAKS